MNVTRKKSQLGSELEQKSLVGEDLPHYQTHFKEEQIEVWGGKVTCSIPYTVRLGPGLCSVYRQIMPDLGLGLVWTFCAHCQLGREAQVLFLQSE